MRALAVRDVLRIADVLLMAFSPLLDHLRKHDAILLAVSLPCLDFVLRVPDVIRLALQRWVWFVKRALSVPSSLVLIKNDKNSSSSV